MDVGGLYVTPLGMILMGKRPVTSSGLSLVLLLLPALDCKTV